MNYMLAYSLTTKPAYTGCYSFLLMPSECRGPSQVIPADAASSALRDPRFVKLEVLSLDVLGFQAVCSKVSELKVSKQKLDLVGSTTPQEDLIYMYAQTSLLVILVLASLILVFQASTRHHARLMTCY